MSWTDERVEMLKTMWSEGKSASQIAKELGGVTRNAVIGKVHRLGLSNRVGGAGPARGRGRARRLRRGAGARAGARAPGSRSSAAAARRARRAREAPPAVRAKPGRPAAAAAAGRLGDQPRGAGEPRRGREEGPAARR